MLILLENGDDEGEYEDEGEGEDGLRDRDIFSRYDGVFESV